MSDFRQEAVEGSGFSLDLNQHAAGLVLDEAAQTKARGQTEDVGTEPDALHDPTNDDRTALHESSPVRTTFQRYSGILIR